MSIDLKSMSSKELKKLRSDIEKAIERIQNKDKKLAIAAAEKAAKKYGLSLADLVSSDAEDAKPKRRKSSKPKKPAAPKYANPKDPSQTWSGRGRRPAWFTAAIEAGTAAEKMSI